MKILTKKLSIAIAALNICALAVAEADNLIVPGQRIGPVRIAMTIAEVYNAMGDAVEAAVEPGRRDAVYWFGSPSQGGAAGDFEVHFWDGRVQWTCVRQPKNANSAFRTGEGLRIGDSEMAVRAKKGAPASQRYIHYPQTTELNYFYKGIMFSFISGRIVEIKVASSF